jgi:hypothetical protein
MEAFQASIASGKPFSELDEALQDAHLQAEEQTPFFQLCWFMSLCGFFGMSKYGGNKDDIGWKLIDVDPHQHAFQSPFGYYDARYMEEHDLD